MKRSNPFESVQMLKSKKTEKRKFNVAWQYHGTPEKGIHPLMYLDGPDISPSTKIAAFDIDGTLVVTKSGKTFPKDRNDWKLFNQKVTTKLLSLHSDGYKIVCFTNQAGIGKKKVAVSDIEGKILDIMQEVGFPFQAFVSTGENVYRKPCNGPWDFMSQKCNGGVNVDLKESFFIGDAAGRVKNWMPNKKKDFSCSDRKFAANIGVKFQTPEEFFNGDKECTKFEWGSIDPCQFIPKTPQIINYDSKLSKHAEMLILVGFPASGKSTFAKSYLGPHGYVVVNRDILKSQDKCLKVATNSLKAAKSVVIDNTNPSKESRKAYIDIAKQSRVPVRCFYFQASMELAQHMNMFRQTQSLGMIRRVPAIAYNMYKSKFCTPDESEGFSEIVKIDFVANFKNPADEALFKKWT